ncbi:MAG: hypothetical protein Q9191_005600 [Dirinaria sp. TL-2023a]
MPAQRNAQQYHGSRNNYGEPLPDFQGYRNHVHEPLRQNEQYVYPPDQEYVREAPSRQVGSHSPALYDHSQGSQSPPVQYDAKSYTVLGERRPPGQSQIASFGPSPGVAPGSRAARFAGKNEGASMRYPPDRIREREHNQRERPSHVGPASPPLNDLQAYNRYERAEGYHEPRHGGPDERPYHVRNDPQPPTQSQGRSERYGQMDNINQNGPSRSNGWDNSQAQRSDGDHNAHSSNPRQNFDKRKVFDDPISPEAVSWDNPFPTFPAVKKKGTPLDGKSKRSMVDLRTSNAPQETPSARPRSADGTVGQRRDQAQHPMVGVQPDVQSAQEGFHGVGEVTPAGQIRAAEERRGTNIGQSRPGPSTSRHSEEAPHRALPQSNGMYGTLDPGRSKTMPSAVSDAVVRGVQNGHTDLATWQEPGPTAGYHGPEGKAYLPGETSTTSGSRPWGPSRSRSDEVSQTRKNPTSRMQYTQARPQAPRQDSIADVYDSYYDTSSPTTTHQAHSGGYGHQSPVREKMPNFDATPNLSGSRHYRGMTIDDHLQPQMRSPEMPAMPIRYQQEHPDTFGSGQGDKQVVHSRSQADFHPQNNSKNDFNFGPLETSEKPSSSHRQYDAWGQHQRPSGGPPRRPGYDHQQSALDKNFYRQPKPHHANGGPHTQQSANRVLPDRSGPSPQRRNRGANDNPVADIRVRSASPPSRSPLNPDALPAHPAPVRAGLNSGPSAKQPPKPAPVRNYNSNGSPLQTSNPTQVPTASPSAGRNETGQVTQQDLDRLRHGMKMNPSDQKIQMDLAKKLVEAAAALDHGVPRIDQRTIQKTKEKYFAESHKIAKRLVSSGNADGMFFLGDCYSQGMLGLEKDPKEAFMLYQSAAKMGHAQAAFRVAVCCELGLEQDGGTKRDLGKAVQWYKRAAQLGDTPAMYKIGVIQLKGLLGQPKDSGEAIQWLRKAADKADKDNPHALHELALWHEAAGENGRAGNDEAYAWQLFQQAAELGYKFSQYRLGRAFEYGMMRCPIDPRQSIAWYSKAAVQEEHQSELALSGWYLTGSEGVLQQSDTEAYLWARKAATAGLAKAEFAMGYFTEVGIGCPPSSEEAKRWYWRAASQNFPKARDRLEELRKGGAKMKKERVSRSAMKQESECSLM